MLNYLYLPNPIHLKLFISFNSKFTFRSDYSPHYVDEYMSLPPVHVGTSSAVYTSGNRSETGSVYNNGGTYSNGPESLYSSSSKHSKYGSSTADIYRSNQGRRPESLRPDASSQNDEDKIVYSSTSEMSTGYQKGGSSPTRKDDSGNYTYDLID